MKKMLFKNLLIADFEKEEAFFATFQSGVNVITSKDNHFGKSCLVKSLYYAFGAEVEFDAVWQKQNKLYKVVFDLDGRLYEILRYQKKFLVIDENKNVLLSSDNVSINLANCLKDVFEFSIYLQNKKENKFELAPPVFYFTPYYLDQDNGWSQIYSSFLNMEQYTKTNRMKMIWFHLGICTDDVITLMMDFDKQLEQTDSLKSKNEKLTQCLDVLNTECGFILPAKTIAELEDNLSVTNEKISKLVILLGKKRIEIQEQQNLIEHYNFQLKQIESETHNQILFTESEKSIVSSSCPHCGSLLTDEIETLVQNNVAEIERVYLRNQIELMKSDIEKELSSLKKDYVQLMNQLKEEEGCLQNDLNVENEYLSLKGLEKTVSTISEKVKKTLVDMERLDKETKTLKRKISKIPQKRQIEETYQEILKSYMEKLEIWDSSFEDEIKILSPLNRQGSMKNKIILSQVLAMLKLKESLKCDDNWFPLVIDSPRGNEISYISGNEILKMLFDADYLPQTIVATTDFKSLNIKHQTSVNVIELNVKKHLLNKDIYNQYKRELDAIKKMFAMIN